MQRVTMSRPGQKHSIVIARDGSHRLSDFRREVLDALEEGISTGPKSRLILAVNEVVANLLRHTQPAASEIRIDFDVKNGKPCCIVRDNGGSFAQFSDIWGDLRAKPVLNGGSVGLSLVKCFFPAARYRPKTARRRYNEFILPLTGYTGEDLPGYFSNTGEDKCPSKTIM